MYIWTLLAHKLWPEVVGKLVTLVLVSLPDVYLDGSISRNRDHLDTLSM